MGTLLSIRNLETSFFTRDGELRAVDGMTCDIEDGTTMGLVGESGCGKSVTSSTARTVSAPPPKKRSPTEKNLVRLRTSRSPMVLTSPWPSALWSL